MKLRKHWPLLVCAVLLLTVAGLQRASVPLYDGVDFPDEPYRYIAPPQGWETKNKPGSATASGLAGNGTNADGIYLSTDEQGPQIYVSFTQRSLVVPAEAGLIHTEVKPLAPDGRQPKEGRVVGNVYRLVATTDKGAVTYAADALAPSYIDMRLPQGYAVGAAMVYRADPGKAWQILPTNKVGSDIYESKVAGLGEYALSSKAPLQDLNKGRTAPVAALVVVVAITAVVGGRIVLIKKRRNSAA